MPNELRPPLLYSLGFFLTLAFLATVSVYGFDQFEHAWGKGGSWQVLIWIATGSSVLALLSALIVYPYLRRKGRSITGRRALFAGCLTSVACLVVLAFPGFTREYGLWVVALESVLAPALAFSLLTIRSKPG